MQTLGWTILCVFASLCSHMVVSVSSQQQTQTSPAEAVTVTVKDEPQIDEQLLNVERERGAVGISSSDLHRSLAFYPTNIDFGSWSIGTAQSHVVTLVNTNSNRSVYLNSISGKTSAFYSSFFEDKIVPPQGNTTFNVVFLPRTYGSIEANLMIHTSFGEAKLPVRGEGKECPYRLRPLVGITAPLNATLTPEVLMYNPHERPIQILEVYSSGGQFQLELPSGGQEGPQALWEIPPFTAKPVIRIKFHGSTAGTHAAYIRIKISGFDEDPKAEQVLVIPVEFEIKPYYGLYSPNPVLDFGSIASMDDLAPVKVNLTNSGQEPIGHYELELRSLDKIVVLSKSSQTITLDPKMITRDGAVTAELIIKSYKEGKPEQPHIFAVTVRADVYNGSLHFQRNTTIFITRAQNYTRGPREFFIKNGFSAPVAVTAINVADNDSSVFRLVDFEPVIVEPLARISLFKIVVLNETANFKTTMRLVTNLTTHEFPLVVCTGLLTRYTSLRSVNLANITESSTIDFGHIPFGEPTVEGYLVIRNRNPIPITIHSWNATNPNEVLYSSVFIGCSHFDNELHNNPLIAPKTAAGSALKYNHEQCYNLQPGRDMAVISISLQSYNLKEFTSTLNVWTDFENTTVNVKYVAVMGRLEIDQSKLHFKNCFPGKRCSADISIHSTFLKTMRINSITVSVPGLVFEYHTQDGLPIIAANAVTDVGRIYFDPQSVCDTRCYVPQTAEMDMNSFKNDKGLVIDSAELRRRTEMFRRFKWNLQSITFTLNTSDVRLFEFKSSVDIVWPMLTDGVQVFPTQEADQLYAGHVVITNPVDRPIIVDVRVADPTKMELVGLSLPLEVIERCAGCTMTRERVFSMGIEGSITAMIPPKGQFYFPLDFRSKNVGTFSTMLHIRNNLTIYEGVWVTAKTVYPQFRFGNRKPGSDTPLLFEFLDQHLEACDTSQSLEEGPPIAITAKRTFTARNAGEVPIHVERMVIGDKLCEGYGFKIMDCGSFELKANSSKKVYIAYTPDFTLSRVEKYLVFKTNLTYMVNFTLVATVPPLKLAPCSRLLQRPYWELTTKKLFVAVLSASFLIVFTIAYLDSEKVLKDHVQNMSKDKGPVQPTFNFKNLKYSLSSESSKDAPSNGHVEKTEKNSNILKKRAKKMCTGNDEPNGSVPCLFSATVGKEKSWASELAKKMSIRSKEAPVLPVAEVAPQPQVNNVPKAVPPKPKEKSSPPVKHKVEKEKVSSTSEAPKSRKALKKLQKQATVFETVKEAPVPKEEKVAKVAPKPPVKEQTPVKPPPVVRIEKKPLQETFSTESKSSDIVSETLKKSFASNGVAAPPTKKLGKTPGRERKKETGAGSTARPVHSKAKFKSNAFQFTSPLPSSTPLHPIPNSWSTSQATFSHVVAQSNNADEHRYEPRNWIDPDSKNFETFGRDADISNFTSSRPSTMDLGPIGTRKSPSNTPLWEPMGQPDVIKPVPGLLNDNMFLNHNNFMDNFSLSAAAEQMRVADHNRQLELQQSEYLMALLQKRHLNAAVSRPPMEPERHQLNAWPAVPTNETSWSPMGYQDAPSPNPWTDPVIQRPNPILRPPPGLENAASNALFTRQTPPHSQQPSPLPRAMQPQPNEPLAAFDPFNSLSSIWSDNWNAYSNNNNN